MMALFANGTTFGAACASRPRPDLDDGLLDLVLVREVSKLELLRVFPRVYRARTWTTRRLPGARRGGAVLADRPLIPWGTGAPGPRPGPEITFRAVPGALRVVTQIGMSSKSALER
jgi:diacylglycerol kinase (ATP)